MPALAATPKPSFTFDEKLLRFRDSRGRLVSEAFIRAELEKVREEGIRRALDLGTRLQSGTINTSQFILKMRDLVKALHAVAGSTAAGGWKQMSPAMWGKLGTLTRQQYEFLNNLSLQLEQGLPINGRLMTRLKMYVRASAATFENFKTVMAKRAGKEEARRVLHAKESCADCVRFAGQGWVDIDDAVPIGQSICRVNCRCSYEYR